MPSEPHLEALYDELRRLEGGVLNAPRLMRYAEQLNWPMRYMRRAVAEIMQYEVLEQPRRGFQVFSNDAEALDDIAAIAATRFVADAVISHWWALYLHGVAPRPRVWTCLTTRRPRLPTHSRRGRKHASGLLHADDPDANAPEHRHSLPMLGRRVFYVHSLEEHFAGFTVRSSDEGEPVMAMTIERSLAACFRSIRLMGGLPTVHALCGGVVATGRIRGPELTATVRMLRNRSLARRLGWSLSQHGMEVHPAELGLSARGSAGARVSLDPNRELRGRIVHPWGVVDNRTEPLLDERYEPADVLPDISTRPRRRPTRLASRPRCDGADRAVPLS